MLSGDKTAPTELPQRDVVGACVTRSQRIVLVALVALISLPHVLHLPLWVSANVGLLLAWQATGIARGWRAPPVMVRAIITLAVFVAVFVGFGRVNGQGAGVSLLTLMLALKLSEVVRYRDVVVVLCLCCFVLVTQFLFSQSLGMAVYLLMGCWLVVAGFVHAHIQDSALHQSAHRHALAESARLLALAIPVAAIFFVLFPRLPGPLWGLPANDHGQATTGLSDRMSPGSLSSLAQSDAVALRARFDAAAPPPAARYWRGPVFWDFRNGTWSNNRRAPSLPLASIDVRDDTYTTDITLAPTHNPWLIALDIPLDVDRTYTQSAGATLLAPDDIDQRIRYIAHSATAYTLDAKLPAAARQRALAIPGNGNSQARALGARWAASGSPAEVVADALQMFRQKPFRYTLNAPRTSQANSVDDFLFRTRAGFCEHFAGAFTFVMRAAGIPARVVTGFQGAEHSTVGNYWIVRNADAHAWSEVWLAGRGWIRVDPTAAVAPSRIERGITAAVSDQGDLPFMARRQASSAIYQARMAWDAVNAGWNRWFLAYGPELQQQLFAWLGLAGFGSAIAMLTFGTVGLLGLVSLWLAWRMRPRRIADPVERAWQGVLARLARRGLTPATGEAPQTFAARVAQHRPDLAPAFDMLVDRLVALRYRPAPSATDRGRFITQARAFRPGRAPSPS